MDTSQLKQLSDGSYLFGNPDNTKNEPYVWVPKEYIEWFLLNINTEVACIPHFDNHEDENWIPKYPK